MAACLVLTIGGCGIGGNDGSGAGSVTPAPVAVLPTGDTEAPVPAPAIDPTGDTSTSTPEVAPTRTPVTGMPDVAVEEGIAGLCGLIGPQWCADADGNTVPDMIETALGYDPAGDDCGVDGCAEPTVVRSALASARAPVLVALDGSATMAEPFAHANPDITRLEAAREAVERLAVATPDYVPVGLMGFGDRGSSAEGGRLESCSAITTHAFPGELEPGSAGATAQAAQAVGWRPVAEIIRAAVPVLATVGEVSDASVGRLVLMTSGSDTCGEDPVAVVEELVARGTAPVVDVVALDVDAEAGRPLQEVARRTGGSYLAVADPAGLADAAEDLAARSSEALRPALCPTAAGEEADGCHRRFRQRVAGELADRAERLLADGDREGSQRISKFALAVDAHLQAVRRGGGTEGELEDALEQVEEARSRFERRYGRPLPGEDLGGCGDAVSVVA